MFVSLSHHCHSTLAGWSVLLVLHIFSSSVFVCELSVVACCRCWVCLLSILQCSCCWDRFSVSASCCLMPETASLPQCWTSWVLLWWPIQPHCLLGMWVLPHTHRLVSFYTPTAHCWVVICVTAGLRKRMSAKNIHLAAVLRSEPSSHELEWS